MPLASLQSIQGTMLREEIKNESVIATFKGAGSIIEEINVSK